MVLLVGMVSVNEQLAWISKFKLWQKGPSANSSYKGFEGKFPSAGEIAALILAYETLKKLSESTAASREIARLQKALERIVDLGEPNVRATKGDMAKIARDALR